MKRVTLVVLLILNFSMLFAQEEPKEGGKLLSADKLFVGGSLEFGFGSNTLVGLTPQFGYRLSPKLEAGLGLNGQTINGNGSDMLGDFRIKRRGAGLQVFGRYFPAPNLVVQLRPEVTYIFGKQKFYQQNQETKLDAEIAPALLAGGGFVLPAGNRSFMLTASYDLLQQDHAPYGKNPLFSLTYTVRLGQEIR